MKKIITLLLLSIAIFSCANNRPTRAERMKKEALEYLYSTTEPLQGYVIVSNNTLREDTAFVGYVGYRCAVNETYAIYKTVFVAVHGDSIVYVGYDEEEGEYALRNVQ